MTRFDPRDVRYYDVDDPANLRARIDAVIEALERNDPGTARYLLAEAINWIDEDAETSAELRRLMWEKWGDPFWDGQ